MSKAAKKAAAPEGPVYVDVEQGTAPWFEARLGIPTASCFSVVMAQGIDEEKSLTRSRYLYRLAGEIITGVPAETFESAAMRRGKEMEAAARDAYAKKTGRELKLVGFVKNFTGLRHCGASPDALIGFNGGLETKTMKPELLIPLLEKGARMLPQHIAQVQGNMWVTERDWWDLSVYFPRMPPYIVRCERNETVIKQIDAEVQKFNYELRQLVERLRNMGAEG